jgi:uncharacterized protein (TIGR03435 family)
MRRIALGVGLMGLTAVGAFGQAEAPAAFEVASVRASQTGNMEGFRRESIQATPGSLTMRNVSLKSSIRWAYHVMDYQVIGPDWIGLDRYDIVAKAAGPATEEQLRPMLQALLAERFKVALRGQTKEMQAFVLTVGKNGPKFHESQTEGESSIEPNQATLSVAVKRTPVSQLVDMLSQALRSPVVDMTGLKGKYDLSLNIAKYVGDLQPGGAPPDPVTMVTMVLREEFGLQMESKKMPLDLLIVDHAEKAPGEN